LIGCPVPAAILTKQVAVQIQSERVLTDGEKTKFEFGNLLLLLLLLLLLFPLQLGGVFPHTKCLPAKMFLSELGRGDCPLTAPFFYVGKIR
jgi:hypothetical protein